MHTAGLVIRGEQGVIRVSNPLAPHRGNEIAVETADGTSSEEVAGDTTYAYQLRHVVDVLQGRAEPLTGGSDAVAGMQVLDEIYRVAGMRP